MADIRANWAQYVLTKSCKADWQDLPDLAGIDEQPKISHLEHPELPNLDGKTWGPEVIGVAPPSPKDIKVGIVGAGCAGLFTGMIFDYLNENLRDRLCIDYEILEAACEERLGGRLYTYRFPPTEDKDHQGGKDNQKSKDHQYYDVGAMRFPEIPIMERVFKLFDYIGLPEKKLIDFFLTDKDTFNKNPTYYNDHHRVGSLEGNKEKDPYCLNDFRSKENRIPECLMKLGPDKIIGDVIADFKQGLKNDIEKLGDRGWQKLMKYDLLSTRQFLSNPTQFGGMGYNFNTISWLETFEYATGWYDQSLAETVLDSMEFDYPLNGKESVNKQDQKTVRWKSIDGGAQQVAKLMRDKLSKKPLFNMEVNIISTDSKLSMELLVTNKNPGVERKVETRQYFAVFNSTTLAALQRMDLKNAKLTFGTKQAIRSLGYSASCKVAIRFSYPWWITKFGIAKGGLGSTDLPIRQCVYPSYNIHDPKDEPAVLLCSYTWSQDAQRIAALISKDSPAGEDELKDLLIRNLTLLHAPTKDEYDPTFEMISKSYISHHAYDWYKDPHMSGAFVYFGPGQFSVMYREIVTPNGWLYLIGEATSPHHSWVVGALESAVRGVYQFLGALAAIQQPDADRKVYLDAMELLTKSDPDNPFGPLPADTTVEIMKNQTILGFFQQKAVGMARETV